MKSTKIKYEMMIIWSEEDDCYLVGFPDFPGQKWRTHGETHEIAVQNGVEALESLILAYEASGESLPVPKVNATSLYNLRSHQPRNPEHLHHCAFSPRTLCITPNSTPPN
jgi:antitoxin HicB